MVSFENFVKSMLPISSELKVTPSFCFPFKIPDDPTATNIVSLSTALHRGLNEFKNKCNLFPPAKPIVGNF